MSNWLAELLDSLERHTQAVQANTAAVHALLQSVPEAIRVPGEADRVLTDLERQLTAARAIEKRLERLREELAPIVDAERCVYQGGIPGEANYRRCLLRAGHAGVHVFKVEGES